MQSKNDTAIVIVTYNVPNLLIRQVENIRMFCEDKHDIIVVDNSNNPEAIEAIRYHSQIMDVIYMKTNAANAYGSNSHAFACNVSYYKIKDHYDYIFYIDHDNFPVKKFSVKGILDGKMMAGLGQEKDRVYFWPGCFMWNNKLADRSIVNFSVSNELGLDTGGMLYKMIDRHGIDSCVFFDEQYCENPHFKEFPYNFYSLINNGMFMHFINSSNWNPTINNEDRINGLLNILSERTDAGK